MSIMKEINYRLIANQVGDLLKYETTIKEIERAAQSIFPFSCDDFPNDAITSSRAKSVHDWVLTLAVRKMDAEERDQKLLQFLELLTPEDKKDNLYVILNTAGIGSPSSNLDEFLKRNLHSEIHKHCKKLFSQKNYFHAVFESAKVYNRLVQQKAQIQKDGESLMMDAWTTKGVLKITQCITETDQNVQEGVKFLSAGLMRAMRNPTAHEPALDWPISKEDCLDMLSFISYLFRQLDKAIYYKNQ
jgi:uncharacterized protein (TIGR02391 family)